MELAIPLLQVQESKQLEYLILAGVTLGQQKHLHYQRKRQLTALNKNITWGQTISPWEMIQEMSIHLTASYGALPTVQPTHLTAKQTFYAAALLTIIIQTPQQKMQSLLAYPKLHLHQEPISVWQSGGPIYFCQPTVLLVLLAGNRTYCRFYWSQNFIS